MLAFLNLMDIDRNLNLNTKSLIAIKIFLLYGILFAFCKLNVQMVNRAAN
jgi:hypothetical protein